MYLAEGLRPATPEERQMAMLAHLSVLLNLVSGLGGPIAALILYLVYRERSRPIAFHAGGRLLPLPPRLFVEPAPSGGPGLWDRRRGRLQPGGGFPLRGDRGLDRGLLRLRRGAARAGVLGYNFEEESPRSSTG